MTTNIHRPLYWPTNGRAILKLSVPWVKMHVNYRDRPSESHKPSSMAVFGVPCAVKSYICRPIFCPVVVCVNGLCRRSIAHVLIRTTRKKPRWTRRPSCVSWTPTMTRDWASTSSWKQPRPVISSWTSSKESSDEPTVSVDGSPSTLTACLSLCCSTHYGICQLYGTVELCLFRTLL